MRGVDCRGKVKYEGGLPPPEPDHRTVLLALRSVPKATTQGAPVGLLILLPFLAYQLIPPFRCLEGAGGPAKVPPALNRLEFAAVSFSSTSSKFKERGEIARAHSTIHTPYLDFSCPLSVHVLNVSRG